MVEFWPERLIRDTLSLLGAKMAKPACWRAIPTELSLEQFEEFILPHLTVGSRGPAPKLSLHALFNYILKLLYLGCQWKGLAIEKEAAGRRVRRSCLTSRSSTATARQQRRRRVVTISASTDTRKSRATRWSRFVTAI